MVAASDGVGTGLSAIGYPQSYAMKLVSLFSGPPGSRRRIGLYVAATLLLVFALVLGAMRAVVVGVAGHRALIVSMLSRKLGRPVRVERIAPYWRGFHPGLVMTGLTVPGVGGPTPLSVARLQTTIAWLPLLIGHLRPYTFVAIRPSVVITRRPDGVIEVAGYRLHSQSQQGSGLRAWLLGQNELVVREGHLLWQDQKRGQDIEVRNVAISARNGLRHHVLSVSAAFPHSMCGHCSVFIDIDGTPQSWHQMSGQVYWHIENLETQGLPPLVQHYLPAGFSGSFSSTAWSRWVEGLPVFLNGNIKATNLRVPETRWVSPIHIHHLKLDVDARDQSGTWLVQVLHGVIALGGPAWQFDKLSASIGPQSASVGVDRVNLDQVAWLLAHIKLNQSIFDAIRKIDPDGDLSDVRLQVRGPLPTVQGYQLVAHAEHLTAAAYGPYPGFSGINGDIRLSGHGGRFDVQSMKGVIFWPQHFASSLIVDSGSGTIAWHKQHGGWQVQAQHFALKSPIGSLGVDLSLALPQAAPALAHLRLTLADVDLQAVRPFYAAIPLPGLRQWLTGAIRSGVLSTGTVHLSGNLARFPFASGGGLFTASGHVVDGRLRYLPHWTDLAHLNVALKFADGGMQIQGRGTLAGLQASPVSVSVANFAVPAKDVVQVRGVLTGPVREAVGVLASSGNATAVALVPKGAVVHGQGQLELAVQVPLQAVGHVGFSGNYHVHDATLALATQGLRASALSGHVRFTQQGLLQGAIRGHFLGGPARVTVRRVYGQQILTAHGQLALAAVIHLKPILARYVRGNLLPWHAAMRIVPDHVPVLQLGVELDQASLLFPAPLHKSIGRKANLEVETVVAHRHATILAAHLGDMLSAQVALDRGTAGWRFARGRVTLGGQAAPLPRHVKGLVLAIVGDAVNLDHWLRVVRAAAGSQAPGVALTEVRLHVRHLVFLHRALGAMAARFVVAHKVWDGTVLGPDAAGSVQYAPEATPPRLALDMTRLVIPPALPPMLPALHNSPVDPATLPQLHIHATHFLWGHHDLGMLDFDGMPDAGNWRISGLRLRTAATDIQADGLWYSKPQNTLLHIVINSTDVGSTLAEAGLPNEVAGGHGSVHGHFQWRGAPSDFGVDRLVATLSLAASNGRFTRLHQGAAKILGLLDIHSIVRYLTLDFSPVFKRGFVFNTIDGKVRINGGSAYTGGVNVRGTSADLMIQGDTDLVRRLFHLRVDVSPQLQNTLTVAGASLFASPVAGAAVLLMQRVFKKEISQETRITYSVTGPWAAPVVRQHDLH